MRHICLPRRRHICLPFGHRPNHVYRLISIRLIPRFILKIILPRNGHRGLDDSCFMLDFWWDIGHESKYPKPSNIGIAADGAT